MARVKRLQPPGHPAPPIVENKKADGGMFMTIIKTGDGYNRRELSDAKVGAEVLYFIEKPTESKPIHASVTEIDGEFMTLRVLGGPPEGPEVGTELQLELESLVFAIYTP